MSDTLFTLFIIAITIMCFFGMRWRFKQRLLNGNPWPNSDAATLMVQNLQKEERDARELRLMKNDRYRILKEFLTQEVARLQLMDLEMARKSIPAGQSERIIEHPSFKVAIKLNANLKINSEASVKVTVYPKRFLGFIFSLEEWVDVKQNLPR